MSSLRHSLPTTLRLIIIALAIHGGLDLARDALAQEEQHAYMPYSEQSRSVADRVAELEYLLEHFSREGDTVIVTGANLQVVNGTGSTNGEPNGLGNLIVGHNEARGDGTDDRSGSHMVVVGARHNYTSFGGIVAGDQNTSTGEYATVSGGFANEASGEASSVCGGEYNMASGTLASVSGGIGGKATGVDSSVVGGQFNTASGDLATVAGGSGNEASGDESSVCGGAFNGARGTRSTVTGGMNNSALGYGSSVTAGATNMATRSYSAVGGGSGNTAAGEFASVSGGLNRTAPGKHNWVAGSLLEER